MVDDPWFRLVLGVFATWRVAHLLAHEDGPWDSVVRLRATLGDGALGRALDCFQCLSLCGAAPVALAVAAGPVGWVLAWLAMSGAACLLERLVPPPAARIQLLPSEGNDDDLLRTAPRGTGDGWPGATADTDPARRVAADR